MIIKLGDMETNKRLAKLFEETQTYARYYPKAFLQIFGEDFVNGVEEHNIDSTGEYISFPLYINAQGFVPRGPVGALRDLLKVVSYVTPINGHNLLEISFHGVEDFGYLWRTFDVPGLEEMFSRSPRTVLSEALATMLQTRYARSRQEVCRVFEGEAGTTEEYNTLKSYRLRGPYPPPPPYLSQTMMAWYLNELRDKDERLFNATAILAFDEDSMIVSGPVKELFALEAFYKGCQSYNVAPGATFRPEVSRLILNVWREV